MIIIKDLQGLRYIVNAQLERAKNILASYKGNEQNRKTDIAFANGEIYGFSQSLMFIDKLIETEKNYSDIIDDIT